MEYVKRNSLGVLKKCEEADASHVMQTVGEYKELIDIAKMYRDDLHREQQRYLDLKKVNTSLLNKLERQRDENDRLCSRVQDMELQISDTKKEYAGRITDLKEHITEQDVAVKQAQKLNENLKRICRERANSDRNITPKKEHDGYLVLQSREWRERLLDKRMVRTWKSVIQTPYDASIEPEVIEKQVFGDLIEGVLVDIGCRHYVLPEDNGKYTHEDDGGVMYCWRYSADYKSGYWCVIIYTTRPLIVPVERRFRNVREKRNKK
jgi:hypothetical protein